VNPPGKPNANEVDGAGCLVGLGWLGLIVALPLVVWFAWMNASSLFFELDWSGPAAFFRSLRVWWMVRPDHSRVLNYIWVFSLGYCILCWQWMAFLFKRRTWVSSRWLWAVSSVYFALVILAIGWGFFSASDSPAVALVATLWIGAIPGFFLLTTLRLWHWSRQPTEH
jgi:hypothetical protein